MPRAAARARRQKKPTYPADPPSPAPSRPGLIPRPTTRPTPGLVPQACLRLATPGRPLAPPGPTRGRPRGPPQPWQPKRLSLLKLYWNETMIGPGQGGRRNLEPPKHTDPLGVAQQPRPARNGAHWLLLAERRGASSISQQGLYSPDIHRFLWGLRSAPGGPKKCVHWLLLRQCIETVLHCRQKNTKKPRFLRIFLGQKSSFYRTIFRL